MQQAVLTIQPTIEHVPGVAWPLMLALPLGSAPTPQQALVRNSNGIILLEVLSAASHQLPGAYLCR